MFSYLVLPFGCAFFIFKWESPAGLSHLRESRLAAAHSLRSHVCEPRRIFADAQIAGKNDLNSICACGRKLCEAF